MSDTPLYEAMREFIRATVALEVTKATTEFRASPQIETREGAPGQDGINGKDGQNGSDGKDGIDGKDGKDGERGTDGMNGRDGAPGERGSDSVVPGPKGEPGERGADGIATREEIVAIVEERTAEINVRTLADYHHRTYVNGTLYKRGSAVAWGGSTWLAMADTDKVPGTSPDWQILAKEGRPGRDRK